MDGALAGDGAGAVAGEAAQDGAGEDAGDNVVPTHKQEHQKVVWILTCDLFTLSFTTKILTRPEVQMLLAASCTMKSTCGHKQIIKQQQKVIDREDLRTHLSSP